MQTVTASPNFKVVIPSVARAGLKLMPSVRMEVVQFDNRVEFNFEGKASFD